MGLGRNDDSGTRVHATGWKSFPSRRAALPLMVLGALATSGCASYRAISLPDSAHLVQEITRLRLDTSLTPQAALRTHRFDPSDGLDMTEVAMLAVANSPDLRLLRADAGVTRAQAFSAGLLPDPQLALSADKVLDPLPGAANAFSAGLLFDIGALLAHSATAAAADAESRKSSLDLLWQEWQTVAKARLLFVKLDAITQSQAVLAKARSDARQRLDDVTRAVAHGLITNDAAAPLLAAWLDATRQWSDLERQRNQSRHDLNALLGVAPEVDLVLVGPSDVASLDAGQVREGIALAPRRRPDLLALQAGFEAQDDRYRGALRAQFPGITLGPQTARDTSDVRTLGLSVGITLPLFNRNRGNIAIESATRAKLVLDYQQRLDTTAGDAHRLLEEEVILRRTLTDMDASMAALELAAQRAQSAFQARNIDALTLTNVESALLARRLEHIAAQEALQEQAIALQALLGSALEAPAAAAGVIFPSAVSTSSSSPSVARTADRSSEQSS
jgi:cobalt-zinc-cadmium efflux system outer membrane protein